MVARVVETIDELRTAVEIMGDVFDSSAEELEAERRMLDARLRADQERTFLAWVDGVPAAAAVAVFAPAGVLMLGGGTVPSARRRGAYHALVRARWDAAVAQGTPTMVVQAGSMSTPILRRLGFVEVSHIRQLVDVTPAT